MIDDKKIALGVFVFSVIALIMVLFFSSFSTTGNTATTGNVIDEIKEEEAVSYDISCSDSDNKDYFVKGNVRYCNELGECSNEEDYCNGKNVVEIYCFENLKYSEEKLCENGCDNGVCLNLVTRYKTSSGGGSGGSGSSASSSSSTSTVSVVHDLGLLNGENTLEVANNERIKFKISGQEYTLIVTSVSVSGISILSRSENSWAIGEEKRIDLNSDEVNDLYVWLRSVNIINDKAKLTLNLA